MDEYRRDLRQIAAVHGISVAEVKARLQNFLESFDANQNQTVEEAEQATKKRQEQ